jgi:2-phosphosulfolactate phosphatase
MAKVEVCLSPALLNLYNIEESNVVVIDIFRATSTIAAAIHNGAASVVPVDSVQECISLGDQITNSVTAGERDGKVAEGLQYGNSPSEYPREFIAGKTLVLTTTNGTRLLHMCKGSKQILSGSFLNLSATVQYLKDQGNDVLLACASWKDKFNIEDTLFAGAVVEQLIGSFDMNCDSASAALQLWLGAKPILSDYIQHTSHYKRLSAYGLQDDMQYCCKIDAHNVLVKYFNGKLIGANS